jgi:hypothetical protein
MSIRSFFKSKDVAADTTSPLKRTRSGKESAEEKDEQPSKRTKTVDSIPENKSPGTSPVKSPSKGKKAGSAEDAPIEESPKGKNTIGGNGTSFEESNITITPEMQERIQKNKQLALEKRKALESSAGGAPKATTILAAAEALPASWKEVLSAEFSKPYFKNLDAYVR